MSTRTLDRQGAQATGRSVPFYARVAAGGLGGFLVALAVLTIAVVIEAPADGLFMLVPAAVAVLIAVALLRGKRWAYVLGAFAGLAGVAFLAPPAAESLGSPDSFFEFTAVSVGFVSLITVIVASVTAFMQSRRSEVRTHATSLELALIRAGVAGLLVLAVSSAVLTVTGIDSVDAADKSGAFAVKMKSSKFEPVSFAVGGSQKLVVKNADAFSHTFTVDALDIDVKFGPSDEKLIVLEGAAPGVYEFYCAVTGHDSMKGTFTVR